MTLPPSITLPANTVVGNAASDAEPAEAIPFSTLAALMMGYLSDTSTSSITVGTGTLDFTISTNKAFQAGMYLTISDHANAANYVSGKVVSYDPSTGALVLDSLATSGSGTISSWDVTLSGPQGATGSTGASGSSFPAASYSYTGAQSAPTTDNNAEFFLGGSAFYTLTFGAATGYPAKYIAFVTNTDTGAGKTIAPNGGTSFILYPGQTCRLLNTGTAWVVDGPQNRWKQAAATVYVDVTNGNDSNDGLAAGTGRALQTIAAAVSVVHKQLDCAASPPTIQLADGTYPVNAGVDLDYPLVGSAQLYIKGNATTPGNVVVSCDTGGVVFNARDLSTTTIFDLTVSTTGNGSTGIGVSQGATIDLNGVNFNAFPSGTHIDVSTWASCNILNNYTINGGANRHLSCSDHGYINYGSFTVTGASGMSFTDFAVASDLGDINAGGVAMTFSGFASVTGTRYVSQRNAVIESGGATFPGSVAGSTNNGGLYF